MNGLLFRTMYYKESISGYVEYTCKIISYTLFSYPSNCLVNSCELNHFCLYIRKYLITLFAQHFTFFTHYHFLFFSYSISLNLLELVQEGSFLSHFVMVECISNESKIFGRKQYVGISDKSCPKFSYIFLNNLRNKQTKFYF